jgi:O-antigen/teichoic acid export membrane protein
VQQATSGSWEVWIYNSLNDKKFGNIANVQKWYMYVMIVLATGLFMISPEIIKILSPPDYWHFEYVVPFVIGSYIMLMYSMQLSVVYYRKKTGVVSAIVSLSAVINIVLNYLLIPRYGGVGAAYTSVVSYLFIFIVTEIYLKIKHDFHFRDLYNYVNLFIITLIGVLFYSVMNTVVIRYLVFIPILLLEAGYAFLKKEEILKIFLKKN